MSRQGTLHHPVEGWKSSNIRDDTLPPFNSLKWETSTGGVFNPAIVPTHCR
jgi:hypothetical protein